MATFDKALLIACRAHYDQLDRYGAPYILHSVRVMNMVTSEDEKITAILHDVIEDSPMTIADLYSEGFEPDIVQAIDCLSKKEGEPYSDYINRVMKSDLAVRIKIADLTDNMNMLRTQSELTEKDFDRYKRYHDAWRKLKKMIDRK